MNAETVKSVNSQLELLKEYFRRGDRAAAVCCADRMISLAPKEAISHIAKAQALLCGEGNTQYADLFPPIKQAGKCQQSPEFAGDLKWLLELGSSPYETRLLMYGCSGKDYAVVRTLVDLGADIHAVNTMGTTALWYVCFKPLASDKRSQGIKIARLLLDRGAKTDVKNANGVALLNETTDSAIVEMIRSRRPEAEMGGASAEGVKAAEAAAGRFDSQDIGVYIGGGIGILLGVVFDTFLLGALFTVVLGFFGGYMGKCIRSRAPVSIIKGIAIFLAAATLCGLLLHACQSGGGKEATRICPNCHTEMPASAVSGGQCTRCDGNDWG